MEDFERGLCFTRFVSDFIELVAKYMLIRLWYLSAILTIFQIPEAAGDPVTRTAAILSLICALMSLTYGCMYIVRFGTMRTMVRASKWAEVCDYAVLDSLESIDMILAISRKLGGQTLQFYGTSGSCWPCPQFGLLGMPAPLILFKDLFRANIYPNRSMVIFMVAILSFVWRTGSESDPPQRPPLGQTAALGTRVAITFVVFVGMIYLILIIQTLKSYGINGSSQNILTSPQTRLGVLGTTDHHQPGRSGEQGAPSHDRSGLLEAALERRGRERTRSDNVRRGRRREAPPEVRDHHHHYADGRRVPVKESFREGNELGLFSTNSNSSMVKTG